MSNYNQYKTCFEDLPDEILLTICRYLSQVDILDSLLNLNQRLNRTITNYREKIFLSHLSYNDFYHLINDHLPNLAFNVNYLYINNCSMLNVGKIFEEKFSKIDQEFPQLTELIFHQIDIETLENLSWRFNTMKCLYELIIDIAEERLLSMPILFDEFLCGKLFSQSNTFQSLKLNLNKYQFNLQSITRPCKNIRHLTISVKHLNDLLVLFNNLPNIEQLNITIGCSISYEKITDIYPYEQLWWKIPYLTKFYLSIEEKDLISHDNVLSNEIILKIVQNIYSLLDFKFNMNINFNQALQLTTTKDVYINKYFPYVDGTLWQNVLQRNDNRNIPFELNIELDGPTNTNLIKFINQDVILPARNDDINFNSILKNTFSSAYWLQKNIAFDCYSTVLNHVSIYTLPLTNSCRITNVDIIDQEISIKSLLSHRNINNLIINSSNNYSSSKLSLTNLLKKYPRLKHLEIESELLLPPTIIICSNYLQSLSLYNYSFDSCNQLIEYLPQIKILSITNLLCKDNEICSTNFLRITQLKLTIESNLLNNLLNLNQYFPNLKEFYIIMKSSTNRISDEIRQNEKFDNLSQGFLQLRYLEITLPIKQDSTSCLYPLRTTNSNQILRIKTSDGYYLTSKIWL